MKWMIASDLHGSYFYASQMQQAFEREQADRLLLLGDLLYHGPRNDLPEGYAPKRVIPLLNGMKDLLPQRLIPVVLDMSYVDENKFINQVSREERHRLLHTLKHFVITISATRPIAEAIVTAGGVSVKEIDPKTMESKRIKGLYFAGEVMDVDGYTGGYNLQAAFSSGHAAGEAAAAEE